jgi:hypothetical protein
VDQFLADVLPRQIEAEKAICNGDPAPRLTMWSSKNPVTLFGADATKQGAEEVRRFFHLVASWFANCTAYQVIWPTPSASSTSRRPFGAARKRRSAPASRTSTGERTGSG